MMVFYEAEILSMLTNLFVQTYLLSEDKYYSIDIVLKQYRESIQYDRKIEERFIAVAMQKNLLELQTIIVD